VKRELVVEVAIEAGAPQQREQPEAERGQEGAHDVRPSA
jgi:hypothetical protein